MTIISLLGGGGGITEKNWNSSHSQLESEMQYLSASKVTKWSVCFQGKPFNITVIQVYAKTTDAKEAEVNWFYEDLQHLLELTPKKMSFSSVGIKMK